MRKPRSWPRRWTSIACAGIAANILPLPSVEEALAYPYTDAERAAIARNRSRLFVGSPATVMAKLQPMITASQADELMVITAVYDHDARKKSYSLLADAFGVGKKAAA